MCVMLELSPGSVGGGVRVCNLARGRVAGGSRGEVVGSDAARRGGRRAGYVRKKGEWVQE